MRTGRNTQLLACALLASACSSTEIELPQAMPFHVALAPIVQAEIIDNGQSEGLRLQLDQSTLQHLNASLASNLRQNCFVDLTQLEPRDDYTTAEEWLALAARETGANLLLTFEGRYGTTITDEANPSVQSAAPFSWLPGPQLWPVPDRRYNALCTLAVYIYDLSRYKQTEGAAPVGVRRWYFDHTVTLDAIYSTYFDRVGTLYHLYLPALILPTTLLDYQDEDYEHNLNLQMVERLAQLMAEDLMSRRIDIIRNNHEYGFFLESQKTEIELVDEGQTARISFTLRHKQGSSLNAPRELLLQENTESYPEEILRLGDAEILAARNEENALEGQDRYTFTMSSKLAPESRYLRLRVSVGRAPVIWREFSLALPGKD
ncbi:MAG: hypothetical protein ACI8X5_003931 [Planctomycetota bacterium]|jgi:hypothetical protein